MPTMFTVASAGAPGRTDHFSGTIRKMPVTAPWYSTPPAAVMPAV
jgi:hypothetical protein